MKTGEIFEFGRYRLMPRERLLLRQGEPVTLTPKVFDLLVLLVENRGRLLDREELLKTLWPDSFIEENNLTVNISTLRKILGEGGDPARYVETVPKRGYRFTADVRIVDGPEPDSPPLVPAAATVTPPAPGQSQFRLAYAAAGLIVLLLGAAAVIALARWISPEPSPILESRPLTSYPGSEYGASLSPDATRAAFTWAPPDHATEGIYLKLIGQGDAIRLTNEHVPSRYPKWSPDGTQIAFVQGDSRGQQEVVLIPAVGGSPRKLADIYPPMGMRGPILNWSPDGRWLLFSASKQADGAPRIMAVSVDTGQTKEITSPGPSFVADTQPALSPDARHLIFARSITRAVGDYYTQDLSPDLTPIDQPRRFTFLDDQTGGATWTPDSKEVVFAAGPPYGSSRLFRLPFSHAAKSSRLQPIPYIGIDAFEPDLRCPHGFPPCRLIYEKFAFQSNLWRLDLQGAGSLAAHQPTPWAQSTRVDQSPDISPDGRKVAFASTRSGNWEIWTCESAGTNCAQLTNFGASYSRRPRWSPDGSTLVFDSRIQGNADIYLIGAGGGKPRRLTFESSNEINPSWSADGRFVYFTSNRDGDFRIWKMPVEGGAPIRITNLGGDGPQESHDGKWVYFFGRPPGWGIWRVPVDGGPEEVVVKDVVTGLAFAPVRNGVYYGKLNPGRLQYYDFGTRKTTNLMEQKMLDANGLAVSPDEKWLLYLQGTETSSDLMYVENFR
jgi:Tol biopolymer transport system component/DNA-binding winged helix-turn-helix (wHTH) protein